MAGPVLVLGGQGFLGSRICDALAAEGHKAVAAGRSAQLRADLLDPESLAAAIGETEPQAVVCAAGISSADAASAGPVACLEANVTGFSNLVQAIGRNRSGCHLTLISSAAVYAPSSTALTEKAPTGPGSVYGASKLAAEKICDWQAGEGRPVAVLRAFNLIGPGQGPDQVPGEFARAAGGTVRVRNPEIRRDFTDVRDAGRAVAAVIGGRLEGTFNLCSGRTLSLRELAALFNNVELDASLAPRNADPDIVSGNPGRLEAATGWSATTTARQSAADLIAGL